MIRDEKDILIFLAEIRFSQWWVVLLTEKRINLENFNLENYIRLRVGSVLFYFIFYFTKTFVNTFIPQ